MWWKTASLASPFGWMAALTLERYTYLLDTLLGGASHPVTLNMLATTHFIQERCRELERQTNFTSHLHMDAGV